MAIFSNEDLERIYLDGKAEALELQRIAEVRGEHSGLNNAHGSARAHGLRAVENAVVAEAAKLARLMFDHLNSRDGLEIEKDILKEFNKDHD